MQQPGPIVARGYATFSMSSIHHQFKFKHEICVLMILSRCFYPNPSPLTPFPIWYDWNDNYLQWTKTCEVSVSLYVKLWKDWIANYNRVVFSSERLPVSYLIYNRRPPRHWTSRWQLYKDVCQPCLRRFFLNARVNFFKMAIVDMVLHISYVAWTLSYNFMRTCTADTFDDLTKDWMWQYR